MARVAWMSQIYPMLTHWFGQIGEGKVSVEAGLSELTRQINALIGAT